MGNHEQLELFDLRPYTSKQLIAVNSEDEQLEETQQCIKYEQLKLDLFPEAPHEPHTEQVRMAE
ncbi:MAG TPA: hypothetical protein DCE56_23505 [Cyanobacteria bacterium UBA8553]|nr:hypothetical protein [Cyanobacteria bacterium UBA8553]HAJ62048.1 hypothetical protein [Cyanobacteria bacterium UBA8543]